MTDRVIIVTHRDLDGIAGAALYTYCKRCSEEQYKVIYIEPSELLKTIRKYYKKGRRYIIIDIGINKDIYDELRYIDLSDVTIEWYDHHIWEEEWVEDLKLKKVNIYIDRSTCATGVVVKNVCRDQLDYTKDIAEIVCGADLWKFNRYESAFLLRYSDLGNGSSWWNRVYRIIKSLLEENGEFSVDHIEVDVLRYIDEELMVLSSLDTKMFRTVFGNIVLCVYVKERHIPSSSIIGNKMLSTCDIAVIINEKLKSVSFRSRRCNVRELAKIFGGGGHERAAGAPLDIPIVYRLLKTVGLNTVKNLLFNKIVERLSKNDVDLRKLCQERY